MHVLTGNYKSDQVHVPAILERLVNDLQRIARRRAVLPWSAIAALGAAGSLVRGFGVLRGARACCGA